MAVLGARMLESQKTAGRPPRRFKMARGAGENRSAMADVFSANMTQSATLAGAWAGIPAMCPIRCPAITAWQV